MSGSNISCVHLVSARAIEAAFQPRLESSDCAFKHWLHIGPQKISIPGGRVVDGKLLICQRRAELIVKVDTHNGKLRTHVSATLKLSDWEDGDEYATKSFQRQMNHIVEYVMKSLEKWTGEEESD